MSESPGERVKFQRGQRGWTQEDLAGKAGVDRRTIQRIEAGETNPEHETVQKLAQAFGVDIAELRFGLTSDGLAALRDQFTCPTCGAELCERRFVDHEYGDTEFDIFACGRTAGWATRPCPKDPAFPRWEDYQLQFFEEPGGEHHCFASGLTDAARSVELDSGTGASREAAERLVRRSYVRARDGSEAAEVAYPLFGTGPSSGQERTGL